MRLKGLLALFAITVAACSNDREANAPGILEAQPQAAAQADPGGDGIALDACENAIRGIKSALGQVPRDTPAYAELKQLSVTLDDNCDCETALQTVHEVINRLEAHQRRNQALPHLKQVLQRLKQECG